MNGQPHTHKPTIRVDAYGDIHIKYGDQKSKLVYVCFPGWRSRVSRVLRRQIRRHDKKSVKAARNNDQTNEYRSRSEDKVAAILKEHSLNEEGGSWGGEILKKKNL